MEQQFSDMSLQMTYERATGESFGIQSRSTRPENVIQVLNDVAAALHPGEFVLEIADTTDPGFHSAAVVTNYRILIGTGPGSLKSIDLDVITAARSAYEPDLTLILNSFGGTFTIRGLGAKGLGRIIHALGWVSSYVVEPPESFQSPHQLTDLFQSWVQAQQKFQAQPELTEEEMHQQLADVLAGKRWY